MQSSLKMGYSFFFSGRKKHDHERVREMLKLWLYHAMGSFLMGVDEAIESLNDMKVVLTVFFP